jgi:hypothetical protein
MKPWGEVSSFRGASTLFEGQQINGHTQREERHREETQRRETQKRETEERSKTQIKKQQIQRGTRTGPRRNVRGSECIVERDCNDD